ncbi:hypothetical protein B0H14DRAFT_2593211 [Mycena olivaceomarginata]|nr:hypothetical protein B0H14DRAFT_2593211 [Mycena olivaceomarginata]
MLNLNKEHTIYDPEFRPPTFRREDPSIFTPTTAILVTVTLKRKGNKKIEGEFEANKEAKSSKNMGTARVKEVTWKRTGNERANLAAAKLACFGYPHPVAPNRKA